MIKTTVLELMNAAPVLQYLSSPIQTNIKGLATFTLRRLARIAQPELSNACAARDSLLDDTNSVAVNGVRQMLPDAGGALIQNPLFSTVISLDCEPLTPAMLVDAIISVPQAETLGPFLKED